MEIVRAREHVCGFGIRLTRRSIRESAQPSNLAIFRLLSQSLHPRDVLKTCCWGVVFFVANLLSLNPPNFLAIVQDYCVHFASHSSFVRIPPHGKFYRGDKAVSFEIEE